MIMINLGTLTDWIQIWWPRRGRITKLTSAYGEALTGSKFGNLTPQCEVGARMLLFLTALHP